MRFASPLIRARLERRYKRFLADVSLADGTAATVHCPNPGTMMGLAEPGMTVWLSRSPSPKRKLAFTWELTETAAGLVGINTQSPNRIVREALEARALPGIGVFDGFKCEVNIKAGWRIDFVIERKAASPLLLEIKNVHLSRTRGLAEFPDCTAARSSRHLKHLADHVRAGGTAAILFVVQRTDCDRFAPAADIDPAFAAALADAHAAGVEVLVHACRVNLEAIALAAPLALEG